MKNLKSLVSFIKCETVFVIAFLCAVVSSFFTEFSIRNYVSYIDFDTIFILFSLMSVVSALRKCGIFSKLGDILCQKVHTVRSLSAVLVLLCFFSSMFITNDVALITFVPFAIALLSLYTTPFYVMYVVILQTIAANTGSMLPPIGNPQNLFIFSQLNCTILSFMKIVLPYTLLSLFLLCVSIVFIPSKKFEKNTSFVQKTLPNVKNKKLEVFIFSILFIMCLLSVMHIIPKYVVAIIVLACIIIIDKELITKVDYMLLLTFCAFFIFTGNISHIQIVKSWLETVVQKNEFIVSLISSQIISNVPSTLLLYPFSSSIKDLLLGVNVGGLGTLVASLASLISYKFYMSHIRLGQKKDQQTSSFKYLCWFTLLNVVFLCVLLLLFFKERLFSFL